MAVGRKNSIRDVMRPLVNVMDASNQLSQALLTCSFGARLEADGAHMEDLPLPGWSMTRLEEGGCTHKTLHAQIVDACSSRNGCPGDSRMLRFSATDGTF